MLHLLLFIESRYAHIFVSTFALFTAFFRRRTPHKLKGRELAIYMENVGDGSSASPGVRIYIDEPGRKAPVESKAAPVHSQKQLNVTSPRPQHQRKKISQPSVSPPASSSVFASVSLPRQDKSPTNLSNAASASVSHSPPASPLSHNGLVRNVDKNDSNAQSSQPPAVSPKHNSFTVTVVQKQK